MRLGSTSFGDDPEVDTPHVSVQDKSEEERNTDLQGKQIFTCFVSYTLQLVDNELRVIVSVIDDEERELAKLL